jgi:voltage-gated potassium channel
MEQSSTFAGNPFGKRSRYRRARYFVYELLHSIDIETRLEYYVRLTIAALIVLNIVAVILETVEELRSEYHLVLQLVEYISVGVFSLEYLLRVWSAVEIPRFRQPLLGRLRYMGTFFAMVDLLSIAPFYLPHIISIDLRFVRSLRLLRLFRVLKLGRYSASVEMMGRVVRRKREELISAMGIMMLILLVASGLMYYLEHEAQPGAFPNMVASLWWGIATLTTIGYGDVYPITVLGKVCAAVISILGIGIVALPSGILVAGFVDELQSKKEARRCPHCGGEL